MKIKHKLENHKKALRKGFFYTLYILVSTVLLMSCLQDNFPVAKFKRVDGQWASSNDLRDYIFSYPTLPAANVKLPLIIFLHGLNGSPNQAEKDYGMTEDAITNQMAIVYAGARRTPVPAWNAGGCCTSFTDSTSDSFALDTLLKVLFYKYPFLDSTKIHVVGISNGGMMAYKYAAESNYIIKSLVSVIGSDFTPVAYKTNVLHIHSILDTDVPFYGGTGFDAHFFPNLEQVIKHKMKDLSCDYSFKEENNKTVLEYFECSSHKKFRLILYNDGGHTWPGQKSVCENCAATSRLVNANNEIFKFFEELD